MAVIKHVAETILATVSTHKQCIDLILIQTIIVKVTPINRPKQPEK